MIPVGCMRRCRYGRLKFWLEVMDRCCSFAIFDGDHACRLVISCDEDAPAVIAAAAAAAAAAA